VESERKSLESIPDKDANKLLCYNGYGCGDREENKSLKKELLGALQDVTRVLEAYQAGMDFRKLIIMIDEENPCHETAFPYWLAASKNKGYWLESSTRVRNLSRHIRKLIKSEAKVAKSLLV